MDLQDNFEDKNRHYLVTELCMDDDLFDHVVAKDFFSERDARDLIQMVLKAVCYCHERDVVHRDLKPENLLLTTDDDDFISIKVGDFGFAQRLTSIDLSGERCYTQGFAGTPGYAAPEILGGKCGSKGVDIWSIGIITYILLFDHDDQSMLFEMIKKEFIRKMLTIDPAKRASVQDLMTHAWVKDLSAASNTHLGSVVNQLKAYKARRKFRAPVRTVQLANRMGRIIALQRDKVEPMVTVEDIIAGAKKKGWDTQNLAQNQLNPESRGGLARGAWP